MDDTLLDRATWNEDGTRSIERAAAIAATRERGADGPSDDEIWAVWERHANGPTNRVDLDRVVADIEGIALDG
ncbi:MAG: hypothetical protein H7287_01755 [Thermoleophilia bacterium]|nr:hypothetical protein [Thermoleophilia bacterium]